jgi:hypothetical protein
MAGDETVAEREAEFMNQFVDDDPKANFSFFATITADGGKLPPILMVKGKTIRRHKQFGDHNQHEFDIWHSQSGWSTEPLMLEYLDWLRDHIPAEPLGLLLDQHRTHTTPAMTEKAEMLGIELIWIPKGATGRYQPLDKRTFGALKAKGREGPNGNMNSRKTTGCPALEKPLLNSFCNRGANYRSLQSLPDGITTRN